MHLHIFKYFFILCPISILFICVCFYRLTILNERIPTVNITDTLNNVSTSHFYPYLGVIIEFRKVDMLITVIHNVISHIPSNWPIQIFHGKDNEEFIRNSALKSLINTGKIFLTRMEQPIDQKGTNHLLTNRTFWQSVRGEKILLFQIDSIMCSNSPHRITDFLQYDFVGAPWDPAWFGYDQTYLVGNGGFSLRTRSKLLQLIEKLPYDSSKPEDVWYGSNLHQVGGKVPKIDEAKKFAMESYFYSRPLAVHRFKLKCSVRNELFKTCPEARLVMIENCE